VPALASRHV